MARLKRAANVFTSNYAFLSLSFVRSALGKKDPDGAIIDSVEEFRERSSSASGCAASNRCSLSKTETCFVRVRDHARCIMDSLLNIMP